MGPLGVFKQKNETVPLATCMYVSACECGVRGGGGGREVMNAKHGKVSTLILCEVEPLTEIYGTFPKSLQPFATLAH